MRRRVIAGGLMIGILGILALWTWPRPKVNVLIITLDTTRADRLGCYGHAAARTPVLDALAASGVLCEHAYTVAPLTLPAHSSLFTGLYPAEHGVRSNGRGRLDESIPTLAEVLKRQGYDTAAFVASFVLDGKFGLDQGFRRYDDDIAADESHDDALHRERDGRVVVDAALEWLAEKRSRPFFCWVHLFDPHAPYLTHADLFGDEFADRPYDAEIAYVDRQVGRLIDALRARGLDSRTLVVVVGDHGEGLGEHLERKHGMTLYDATMHVPLIFHQIGRLVPGTRVAGNASMVDIAPTIMDLLALPEPRTMTGTSMAAGLRGGEFVGGPTYGATDEPFLNNGWSPLRSLTEASWKYIRTTRAELYDLADDPGERRNLADTHPARTAEMESRLSAFESRLVLRGDAKVQLRPDEKRALESLGYLGAGKPASAASSTPVLSDIKDMLPIEAAVEDAADLVSRREMDAAIGRLREIVSQVPSHSRAHCYLARALRDLSRFDEASAVLRSLLEARPDDPEGHHELGLIFLAQERTDDAAFEFTTTLALDSDYAEAHYDLAMIHVHRGELEDALSHFAAVLEIDHGHGATYCERGTLLVRLGRVPEGIADYRMALKYAPRAASLHHNLGVVLADQGRNDEALQHLELAVELSPESAEFRYSLGQFLMAQRRYDEAIRQLSKAVEFKPAFAAARERLEEARAAQQNLQRRAN